MINTKNYFIHRVNKLNSQSDRAFLGEREVKTLLTVMDVHDTPESLKGKMIVDLGCGDQYVKNSFEIRGGVYRGIDIDECNLEFDKLPLEDNSVDIAISMAVLEHLRDPGYFLSEAKRVLKPDGVFWISTPDIQACGVKFWDDPTHVHPYTRKSLRMLLLMNSFKNIQISPNYRCKQKKFYSENYLNFFRARYLMLFTGTSKLPVPEFLKGRCTGLFALAKK